MSENPERTVTIRLFLCTAAALGAIAWGALFLIAPVWQFSGPAVPYTAGRFVFAASEVERADEVDVNAEDELPDGDSTKAEALFAGERPGTCFSACGILSR